MSFLILPNNCWKRVLSDYLGSEDFAKLDQKVESLYQTEDVLPNYKNIFKALELTDYPNVKAVIIGQDPYPDPKKAMGLSFSVRPDVPVPQSLRNIYKELQDDLKISPAANGDLTSWAKSGVLLLNNVLTVRATKPNSHRNIGWRTFTDAIIKVLVGRNEPIVFILWGNNANTKARLIPNHDNILVIKSSHPSNRSANHCTKRWCSFNGSRPFHKANEFLIEHDRAAIDW